MTLDGFRRYIKAEMEKGIPFIAYWYNGGMGLLRTGPIERPPLIRWALHTSKRKKPILYESDGASGNTHRYAPMLTSCLGQSSASVESLIPSTA